MTSNTWDPNLYLRNAGLRTRPAIDLVERIPADAPEVIYDLGCGPGNSTDILKRKWPGARITGVDSSAEMIEKARTSDPDINWQVAHIEDWQPDQAPDLIFANASLHWVQGHKTLFPRLLGMLRGGGTLAIQMPNNFQAYSHKNIDISLKEIGLYEKLADKLLGSAVQPVPFYHDLLRPLCNHLDVWETEYMQVLTGEDPVYTWVKATTLLPVEANLSGEEFSYFSKEYKKLLNVSYPKHSDDVTLYPFRRMFMIAQPQTN